MKNFSDFEKLYNFWDRLDIIFDFQGNKDFEEKNIKKTKFMFKYAERILV